ncbi:MAG: glyceraldehyde-3-phosphate dehydrogenase [Nitrospiraceae bacterium]|nr:MAG: glyceraldehyde-3-phosphate dehydrogenase [Nitrospiraceae bacterium]
MENRSDVKLGINGLGRIGKLSLWNHVEKKYFKEIVVNVGRDVGSSLHDIAHYIIRDSTYGSLPLYLYGCKCGDTILDVDEQHGTMTINDVKVTFLRKHRNPKEIDWQKHGVRLVVDATGRFLDPALLADSPTGAVRGHLEAGAHTVIVSAPFKIRDKSRTMPEDALTAVMGINENDYDPLKHRIISAASCTTTCLGHMMKPLLDTIGAKKILTASMATVHAATGSQEVLDRLAKPGATDLRKSRGILNNIILTTTGAANTLSLVIPEMRQIGFMAESVRVPITTGSLIILVVSIQEEESKISINKHMINDIFRKAAASPNGYVVYSEEQNVSGDIIAMPKAAVIIEASETHTRTAEVSIDLEKICGIRKDILAGMENEVASIPLTQAVIYGWYDNEMGNYVHMLGELTLHIAGQLD